MCPNETCPLPLEHHAAPLSLKSPFLIPHVTSRSALPSTQLLLAPPGPLEMSPDNPHSLFHQTWQSLGFLLLTAAQRGPPPASVWLPLISSTKRMQQGQWTPALPVKSKWATPIHMGVIVQLSYFEGKAKSCGNLTCLVCGPSWERFSDSSWR
jgi:hypothetical protein